MEIAVLRVRLIHRSTVSVGGENGKHGAHLSLSHNRSSHACFSEERQGATENFSRAITLPQRPPQPLPRHTHEIKECVRLRIQQETFRILRSALGLYEGRQAGVVCLPRSRPQVCGAHTKAVLTQRAAEAHAHSTYATAFHYFTNHDSSSIYIHYLLFVLRHYKQNFSCYPSSSLRLLVAPSLLRFIWMPC